MKYRRHKNGNYTCIDNHVFRDNSLSMKAKGLLAQIYSLPDDWEYSVKGLTLLFSDGKDAVNNALQELIDHGYVIRSQRTNRLGKFDGYEYDIYETPQIQNADNPITENPSTDNPITEKSHQLNTNILNTKVSNTKELNIEKESKPKKESSRFIPPTIEEVSNYCNERGNSVNPQRFIDHYTSNGWMVGKNKMKDWKAAVRTWERNSFDRKPISKPQESFVNPFAELERELGYDTETVDPALEAIIGKLPECHEQDRQ